MNRSINGVAALLIIVLAIFSICMSVYGLYLAFSASIILGIVVLLVEPSPFLIGVLMFFFDYNLAQVIVDLF